MEQTPAANASRMMAAINNLVLGVLARRGVKNMPQTRRRFAAYLEEAVALAVRSLAS